MTSAELHGMVAPRDRSGAIADSGRDKRGVLQTILRSIRFSRQIGTCHVELWRLSVHIVDTEPKRTVPGAQSIARAAQLLRLVTSAGSDGMPTAELARRADLTRPTTHRLLTALRHEGLVDQDDRTGRWMPGPELFLMGTVAASRYDITSLARDIVRSLAVRTEESAFLSVRRGDETVCLLREEGSFPIRSFVLSEGVRFPLGVASAGLAILAFLPPHDVDAYFERHADLPREWGASHSEPRLRARLRDTKERGYAVNPGLIVEGSYGIGAAVFTREGHPQWALSLTGVEFRFGPERLPELGRTLLAHAHQLTTRIAAAR
jgi:DNA-binding IclR family transcriptional regulator